jgi:hypothetical protein
MNKNRMRMLALPLTLALLVVACGEPDAGPATGRRPVSQVRPTGT